MAQSVCFYCVQRKFYEGICLGGGVVFKIQHETISNIKGEVSEILITTEGNNVGTKNRM